MGVVEYQLKEKNSYKSLYSMLHYVGSGSKSLYHMGIEAYEQSFAFPNLIPMLDFYPSRVGPVSRTFYELMYHEPMTPNFVKQNNDKSFSLTDSGLYFLNDYADVHKKFYPYRVYSDQLKDIKATYERLDESDIIIAVYYKFQNTLDIDTVKKLYANRTYRMNKLKVLQFKGFMNKETVAELETLP